MGKLCAVLITFSPPSGPSISKPNSSPLRNPSPLGEIKFNFFSLSLRENLALKTLLPVDAFSHPRHNRC